MKNENTTDLMHDLVLPTVLFASLGAMTWAIRGCSGFGGESGCLFAGVLWGAAWWFIAREPAGRQSRRYASGWISAPLFHAENAPESTIQSRIGYSDLILLHAGS